jgi:hypothetical protein
MGGRTHGCFVSEQPEMGMQVNELGFKGVWARRTTKDFAEGYWEYSENFMLFITH